MLATAETLAGIKLFERLSLEERNDVAARCRFHRFVKGEDIVRELDSSRDVYFLVSGQVRASILSRSGKEVSFRDIIAGEVFGDLAAIDGMPRSSNVIALEDSAVLSLSDGAFWDMLQSYPSVSSGTLIGLTNLVRRLSERIFEFSTLGVRNRIHAELLRLALNYLDDDGERATITQPPRHLELAARISTNREAVTRELNHLEAMGLIERAGGTLCVCDVARLRQMVEEVKGAEM